MNLVFGVLNWTKNSAMIFEDRNTKLKKKIWGKSEGSR